ncbi:hypothetical protein FQA39_LY10224 [Lamprigera yunnana]|nr:hypothetical protein FQA39_LY10224 [Lamprigera yunnana]
MEPHDGINASTFYGRRYKDLKFAIGDLEDDDRQIDLTIISPSPDYETDLDDIDKDNNQSDVLPEDVPDEIKVFTKDSEYDSDDNIPLARFPTINSNGQTNRRKIGESEPKWTKHNFTNLVAQSATIDSPTINPSGIQNLAHDMNVCTQLTICFPDDQQSALGCSIILSRNERSPGRDIDEAVLMIDQPSTSSLIHVFTRIDQPTTFGLNLPSPFKRTLLWQQPVQLRSTKRREKLATIVTSPQMLEYYMKRDDKKRAAEKQKEDRKLLREAKRKES